MHPLTLLLSLIVICLSWIHAGTRSEYLGMIPWLALLVLVTTLIRPQRKRDEPVRDARARVARSLFRDPVFYAFGVLLSLLWVQNLNSPRDTLPIVRGRAIQFASPPWGTEWPWSIDSFFSLEVLLWFIAIFAIVIGIRHGLLKASRRNLFMFCCWNGAALAAFGVVQYAWMLKVPEIEKTMYGITPVFAHNFATFGYQNHAGQYFLFLFILSLALLFHRIEAEEEPAWVTWSLLVPIALNFTGALLAISRASIILAVASLALFVPYGFIRLWPMISVGTRVKTLVLAAVAIATAIAWYVQSPQNIFESEMSGTDYDNIYGRFFENYQVPTAYRMWAAQPAFGVGGWSYRYLVSQYLPMEDWKLATGTGQANVHNDFVQFLAEYGVVGAGAMLFIMLALLFACTKPLVQYQVPEYHHSVFFFRLPFVSLLTLAAALFMVLDSVVDIPFRSPACMAVFCVGLLCASSFTPASWRRASSSKTPNKGNASDEP